MNLENTFLCLRSIQVCHLRSKMPLTSVDHLRGPPRPIQRSRWPPRVLCWPAGSARGGVGRRRDEQGPTPDSTGPSLPTPSPSPTTTYRRSRGLGRALLGSVPLKLRGGDGELCRPPSSSLLRHALLRPRAPRAAPPSPTPSAARAAGLHRPHRRGRGRAPAPAWAARSSARTRAAPRALAAPRGASSPFSVFLVRGHGVAPSGGGDLLCAGPWRRAAVRGGHGGDGLIRAGPWRWWAVPRGTTSTSVAYASAPPVLAACSGMALLHDLLPLAQD